MDSPGLWTTSDASLIASAATLCDPEFKTFGFASGKKVLTFIRRVWICVFLHSVLAITIAILVLLAYWPTISISSTISVCNKEETLLLPSGSFSPMT